MLNLFINQHVCVCWWWYDTTLKHSSGTHYGRDVRVMSLYGMERPYNDGNTMIQDQFVKPFKPVSSDTGLFQDDPRLHAKL